MIALKPVLVCVSGSATRLSSLSLSASNAGEVGVLIARHRPDEARLASHPEESDSVHPLDR